MHIHRCVFSGLYCVCSHCILTIRTSTSGCGETLLLLTVSSCACSDLWHRQAHAHAKPSGYPGVLVPRWAAMPCDITHHNYCQSSNLTDLLSAVRGGDVYSFITGVTSEWKWGLVFSTVSAASRVVRTLLSPLILNHLPLAWIAVELNPTQWQTSESTAWLSLVCVSVASGNSFWAHAVIVNTQDRSGINRSKECNPNTLKCVRS